MELFCNEHSVPFHHPVDKEKMKIYYKFIKHPIDLFKIRDKLSQFECDDYYNSVEQFLHDINQIFINCAEFNEVSFIIVTIIGEITRVKF